MQKSESLIPNILAPTGAHIYLWLCCEGWQRFGPFQWLSFQDKSQTIVDQDGKVIAELREEAWRTKDPRFDGFAWSKPTITISARHPHPNCGGHPRYRS